jgi:hypothetical protein
MNNTRNVQLPEDLCQAAETRFGNRFASVNELIVSVLQELLREDVLKMDERELQVIEQRLRGLGYV